MSAADLERLWENHSAAITAVFVLAVVASMAFRVRGKRERLDELRAQQRATAASLGFTAPGSEPDQSPLDRVFATLADGPERFGRFPKFDGYPRVRIQLEGERRGMKLVLFTHKPMTDYEKEPITTCAFFGSADIDVPEFRLQPVGARFSPQVEAVLDFIGKGFAKFWAMVLGPADPEIQFPERPRFGELYALTSSFTVRIRDAYPARVLEFFEKHPGWTVEGANGRLLVYRDDVEEPPDRIAGFVSEATAVAEVFRKPSEAPSHS